MITREIENGERVARILETMRQKKTDPTPYDIALRMTSEVMKEGSIHHGTK